MKVSKILRVRQEAYEEGRAHGLQEGDEVGYKRGVLEGQKAAQDRAEATRRTQYVQAIDAVAHAVRALSEIMERL